MEGIGGVVGTRPARRWLGEVDEDVRDRARAQVLLDLHRVGDGIRGRGRVGPSEDAGGA